MKKKNTFLLVKPPVCVFFYGSPCELVPKGIELITNWPQWSYQNEFQAILSSPNKQLTFQ